jgi:hypothetical protein
VVIANGATAIISIIEARTFAGLRVIKGGIS